MVLTSILWPPMPNRSQSALEVTFISPLSSMKLSEKFSASFQRSQTDCRYWMSPCSKGEIALSEKGASILLCTSNDPQPLSTCTNGT